MSALTPDEALRALEPTSAPETVGSSGCPLVAIDLRGTSLNLTGELADRLIAAVDRGPWITVALVAPETDARGLAIAESCDVVLGDTSFPADRGVVVVADDIDHEIRRLTEAVIASPDAAVALAQLLRLSSERTIPQALFAESVTYGLLQTGEVFGAWLAQRRSKHLDHIAESDVEPAIALTRSGSHLEITLNRPHRRNALNVAMRDGLADALALIATDRDLDGATLRGAGDNFCAGGDLDEFGTTPTPFTGHQVRMLRSLPSMLHQVRDRVRVQVHGACVGAGIELPAFAHSVVAASDTTIRLPEVGFGLVPGAGGTVSVTRRIGRHRTAWLALTGVTIDVERARSWGLVDRIAR